MSKDKKPKRIITGSASRYFRVGSRSNEDIHQEIKSLAGEALLRFHEAGGHPSKGYTASLRISQAERTGRVKKS